MGKKYDESSIQNLGIVEGVRKRPSTFINNLGKKGLFKLFYELVQNANDEASESGTNYFEITLNSKIPEMTVLDHGRGIPIGSIGIILDNLFSGGKYNEEAYGVHSGSNGLGLAISAIISEYFIMEVHRDNKVAHVRYENGYRKYIKVEEEPNQKETGTLVKLKPDMSVFYGPDSGYNDDGDYFDETEVVLMLDGLSITHPGNVIKLNYDDKKYTFKFNGTIADYMYLTGKKNGTKFIIDNPCLFDVRDEYQKFRLQACISFSKDTGTILSYMNRFPTVEHGTHVTGVKTGITRVITQYIKDNNYVPKTAKFTVSGADIIDNAVLIVMGEMPNPLYDAQTKNKLTSENFNTYAAGQAYKYFTLWANTHRDEMDKICKMAVLKAKANYAAKEAREQTMNPVSVKNIVSSKLNMKNFTDCSGNNPKENEIYLCEGLSASNALVMARDARTQAYLALRGKILNVTGKVNPKLTEELQILISVLGIKGKGDKADYSKLRYNRIIIMADSDPDGSHITSLALGFFLAFFPKLIEDGHVFIATPPFYRLNYPRDIHLNILNETYFFTYKMEIALKVFELIDPNGKTIDKKVFSIFLARLDGFNSFIESYAKELNLDCNLLELIIRFFDDLMNGNFKMFKQLGFEPSLRVSKKNYRIYYFDKGFEHYFLKVDNKFYESIYKPIYKRMSNIYLGNVRFRNKKTKEIYGGTLYHLSNCFDKMLVGNKCKLDRYKGLGEINSNVLRETAMDIKTRKIVQVTMNNVPSAIRWAKILLSDENINAKKDLFMEDR